ncbi:MAG: thiolase domain-containing protein [Pseudomonadota bacterium]|nr:thiolase domain-containing protein [Pseudomonadota bacterium]
MVDVAVIGVGQTCYGMFPQKSLKDLFHEAAVDALKDVDKGLDPMEVEEAYIGSLSTGGAQLGNFAPLMMEASGMIGASSRHIENACASSGFAMRDAVAAIASGRTKIAVAGGVEKMSDLPREKNRLWLGVSGDVEWERLAGTNFAGIYAMMARRHMYEFGTEKKHITIAAVKNRANALANPKAQFRIPIDLERAMNSPNLASPLSISESCGITDGASVIILCRADMASNFTKEPVLVVGSGGASDYVAIHDRPSMTTLEGTRRAAKQAYNMAGIAPKNIDFAEVHDCFAIAELLAYEDLGLCDKGDAGKFILSGATARDGICPVNNSGGLIAKGHPIGSTGTGQIYEVVNQLRGRANTKERQLMNVRYGLTQNVGGSGAAVAVHILKAVG